MEIKRVPIDSLHLDPANARTHGPQNLEAIEGSLRRFGQAEPLVVQASTGRVIGGNGRLVVMEKMGWEKADIVEIDVDDLQATALGIALNRTSELAEWDEPGLVKLLQELQENDDLTGIGYSAEDIDKLLDELQKDIKIEAVEDEVPEPPEAPVTQPGDLWILGRHRLLCGDSSKKEDVDRLVNGEPIHLVNTDPPYNVKVEPRSRNAIAAGLSSFWGADGKRTSGEPMKMRAKDRPLKNDFVTDEEFNQLLHSWFGNISRVLQPGRAFYIWAGYSNLANFPKPLSESGLFVSQCIVWVKLHPVLTRKDYMGNFELAFYGWREGSAHRWFGPNNAIDTWEVKKISPQAMLHLTQKPTELATRAIQNSSRVGENVLDLFGGSGSTLMGAEQTNRNAYLMEIDPLYCDVIVQRWQKSAGSSALLDSTGKTYEEMARERLLDVVEEDRDR